MIQCLEEIIERQILLMDRKLSRVMIAYALRVYGTYRRTRNLEHVKHFSYYGLNLIWLTKELVSIMWKNAIVWGQNMSQMNVSELIQITYLNISISIIWKITSHNMIEKYTENKKNILDMKYNSENLLHLYINICKWIRNHFDLNTNISWGLTLEDSCMWIKQINVWVHLFKPTCLQCFSDIPFQH